MVFPILLALALPITATPNRADVLHTEAVNVVQQQGQGVLYIEPLPPSDMYATAGKGSSTIEGYDDSIEAREARSKKSYNVYIEVVGIKKVKLTQKEPVVIKELNTTRKYLLKVYGEDGKTLLTSFHFSFKSKGVNKLRLSYHPFYSSWRLDDYKK